MKGVSIWEKSSLSLEEAAAYSGIGINKLRELTNEKDCHFVLWVGNKRLIKRACLTSILSRNILFDKVSHLTSCCFYKSCDVKLALIWYNK